MEGSPEATSHVPVRRSFCQEVVLCREFGVALWLCSQLATYQLLACSRGSDEGDKVFQNVGGVRVGVRAGGCEGHDGEEGEGEEGAQLHRRVLSGCGACGRSGKFANM